MTTHMELREVAPEDMVIRKSIKVGDTVRSYDFHPAMVKKEMYVEGTVIGLQHDGQVIEIQVEKEVGSRPNRITVTTPIESMFMDFPERIMKIN